MNNCICFLLFLIVWLIDRFAYYVNQRINQLLCGWNNNSIYFAVSHNWNSFQYQRIGILMLGYHMFNYSFFQSIICSCFWLMHEWLEDWIDAYCASYFIISLTKNNANNNNIVNEYQNRWLIMKILICVQKQCLEQIWNDEQQKQQWMNER